MPQPLHLATRKGLFFLEPAADPVGYRIASAHFLGDPVTMMLHDEPSGMTWAAVGHGHFGVKMHRTADGGRSWQEVASPAYPERPADQPPDRCPMRGIEIPWRTEMVWSLEAGPNPRDPARRTLWCGTLPGGLFRSDDLGDSWSLCESLWHHPERLRWFGGGYDYPGIHSIAIDPAAPASLTLGISCGGLWKTSDAGQTWTLGGKGMQAGYMPPGQSEDPGIQDAHRVAQCAADPSRIWVQHHSGIFCSSDGGMTFRAIEDAGPSTFGFAVAAHPRDPQTAWFAPAIKDEQRIPRDGRVVVTRTRDGGATFETLSRGLPQENSYHLMYRHALDVDAAGDTLAMGSTTGSLWVSPDQGDQWHRISAELPPVYAVRFAGHASR